MGDKQKKDLTTEIKEFRTELQAERDRVDAEIKSKASSEDVDKLQAKSDRLKARIDALEAASQVAGAAGEQRKSVVDLIAEHPAVQTARAGKKIHQSAAEMPTIKIPSPIAARGVKVGTALTSDQIGDFVEPVYAAGYGERHVDEAVLVDLLPKMRINGLAYVNRKETAASATGALSTTLAAAVTSGAGTTATMTNVSGMYAGMTLRFHLAASTPSAVISSINTTTKVVTFTATLAFDADGDERVTSTTWATIDESAEKPAGWFAVSSETLTLQTVPTYIPVTEQQLSANPAIETILEEKMAKRIRYNLGVHVLYGDSTANQLHGFSNESDAPTYAWSDGDTGDNRLDAVLRASEEVKGNGQLYVVMCRRDWGKITRMKDENGRYLVLGNGSQIPFVSRPGFRAIGELIVVVDEAVTEGDFFVIDIANASELVDNGDLDMQIGRVSDQFIKNEVTMRLEGNFEHAIKSPDYYVVGEWDSAPA